MLLPYTRCSHTRCSPRDALTCGALTPGALTLSAAEYFVVYLTAKTWTLGRDSGQAQQQPNSGPLAASQSHRGRTPKDVAATNITPSLRRLCSEGPLSLLSAVCRAEIFAAEVEAAMQLKIHLLLCHEEPGPDADARHACPFERFFICEEGDTPRRLVNAGIYRKIAVPLQGTYLRATSLALIAEVLSALTVREHATSTCNPTAIPQPCRNHAATTPQLRCAVASPLWPDPPPTEGRALRLDLPSRFPTGLMGATRAHASAQGLLADPCIGGRRA